MRPDSSLTASVDARPSPDVDRGGAVPHQDGGHEHASYLTHERDVEGEFEHGHRHVEATPPTEASRAVVINVGEHTGALVLASSESRSGTEVEIHPVGEPNARTHVWVLPREGRDGIVYAAIFPSLECDDYAILGVHGAIDDVITVLPNRVTHARWE
jgi:hypothetical protein